MDNLEAGQPPIEKTKSEAIIAQSQKVLEVKNEGEGEVKVYSCEVGRLPEWFNDIKDLPRGYCFIGGVARGVLLEQLGDFAPEPRDLDVAAIGDFNPDLELRDKVSREFMPDDYSHGHGVQVYNHCEEYFMSRDFTLNEVLIVENTVYFTDRAIADLENRIVRPTEYVAGSWESYELDLYGIPPKLAVKALLLQAEFLELYGKSEIVDIKDWQWKLEGIPPFHLALGLEKAHQKKLAIPFYVQLLDKSNIIEENLPYGESLDGVKRLAYYVRRKMLLDGGTPFEFTYDYLNVDPEIENGLEEAWEKYYDMANEYSGKVRGLGPRERPPRY